MLLGNNVLMAQLNAVEFGRNRVQYRNFKWSYFQTNNFNSYYYEHGEPLAKFVAQVAEKELSDIEGFVEYGLQRRANIVIYNHFNEMEQSNIGLRLDWQSAGGNTKLVNNKIIIYYTANHANLRKQVRNGIARILLDNILFGDDLGEFAANQALLDLPKWLTDGYVDYVSENWSTEYDDQLKSAILSGNYKNFYQLAFEKPLLAGHSFWYYIGERYKKENITYLLYLARVYRNLNSASNRIAKKKFKLLLRDFMTYQSEKYDKDIRGRRNAPKGLVQTVEQTTNFKKFFRYSPSPAPRSQTYAVIEFDHGRHCVVLNENFINRKILLKTGTRSYETDANPAYPLLAWDTKGTSLAVLYNEEGKIKLFVYDVIARYKRVKITLPEFEQIQDMKFMLDKNTLLLSAVKNGQSDIYTYKLDKQTHEQITNDIYDDLDASFVAFPNKSGIIYASNRPTPEAVSIDTVLPSNYRYNIFLVDNWNKSEFKQISKLTNLQYGNARFPMQYNNTHFTFVADENGIGNRWAGYFTTERDGIDSIYKIGDDVLRNPDAKELDSTLSANNKEQPDTIIAFSVTKDSVYAFPLTNYQSSLTDTKIAGDAGLVSEVRQEGDLLFFYKLKVDENSLKKRNLNPKPTEYRRKLVEQARIAAAEKAHNEDTTPTDTTNKNKNIFETEFGKDSSAVAVDVNESTLQTPPSVLVKAKQFDYKLKFFIDNVNGGFSSDVLINRYQPYTRSLPVNLNANGGVNFLFKAVVMDIMEDLRFTGAIRPPLINTFGPGVGIGGGNIFIGSNNSLLDAGGEWYARFDYLKKRIDYSAFYYRQTQIGSVGDYSAKLFTNLYQGMVKYPLDRTRSIRFSSGVRRDVIVVRSFDTISLKAPNQTQSYLLSRLEYIYDNAINPATNIYKGVRYKVYMDYNTRIAKKNDPNEGKNNLNFGFEGRYYQPIYRNVIWAGRVGADFSWGKEKTLYYLGGADGWLSPKANLANLPQDPDYAFQGLAVNLRGHVQNVANGNNAMVINSEVRTPVFSTFFNKPINNAFLRNLMITQFIDLGTAWNGAYNKLIRPSTFYPPPQGSTVGIRTKAGGIGPFVGGYGFGVRSTLLGYFIKLDAAWPLDRFFRGKPLWYFGLGLDF
jgi:Tol biopolymer transport system component